MMQRQQHCRFCSQSLKSLQEVLDHYKERHGINKGNSSIFENYIDAISRNAPQMFVEYCEKIHRFFDLRVKAEHYLHNHLKLLPASRNDMLIRRVGDKFIEFSIDYTQHSNIYDFKNPGKVIGDFIENVAHLVLDVNGEFRLICCIVNQSATELHGKRLYTNSCFTTGIIENNVMNIRIKEICLQILKKGF